jgi:hypothetical protein
VAEDANPEVEDIGARSEEQGSSRPEGVMGELGILASLVPNSGAARPGGGCPPSSPLAVGAGAGIEEPVRIHQSNSKEGPWSYSNRWNKKPQKEELT